MVEFGFYALPVIMLFVGLVLISYAPNTSKTRVWFTLIIVVWEIYVLFLSKAGLLDTSFFPPRIPLLLMLPALVIIIIGTGTKRFKHINKQIPPHLLIYAQSFRIIVELLIFGAFLNGIFPEQVTFEGTNFDVLAGISAIPMGYLVQKGKIDKKGILVWNVICLLLLMTAIGSFVYSYYLTETPFVSQEFVSAPYVYLAGFLAPMAVFFHVLSIRQQLSK